MKRSVYETRYQSQISKVIEIHHHAATSLIDTLTTKQTNKKNKVRNSITVHKSTNSLILQGTKPFIDRTTRTIQILDVPQNN